MKPELSMGTFEGMPYRILSVQKDTALPNLVFVHGSPGEAMNFGRYLKDSTLQTKANMLAYDRIGYNYEDEYSVQESIAFEVRMLEDLIKNLDPQRTILVGYSYGGPIALGSKKHYKKILLLAPAVYSKVEPVPSMVNFYRWKLTRWLVPSIWKSASKEKLSHQADLEKFQDNWHENPSPIVTMHGDADWIVPYGNATFIKEQFPAEQFELITLPEAGHDLVWSRYDLVKKQMLRLLKE